MKHPPGTRSAESPRKGKSQIVAGSPGKAALGGVERYSLSRDRGGGYGRRLSFDGPAQDLILPAFLKQLRLAAHSDLAWRREGCHGHRWVSQVVLGKTSNYPNDSRAGMPTTSGNAVSVSARNERDLALEELPMLGSEALLRSRSCRQPRSPLTREGLLPRSRAENERKLLLVERAVCFPSPEGSMKAPTGQRRGEDQRKASPNTVGATLHMEAMGHLKGFSMIPKRGGDHARRLSFIGPGQDPKLPVELTWRRFQRAT